MGKRQRNHEWHHREVRRACSIVRVQTPEDGRTEQRRGSTLRSNAGQHSPLKCRASLRVWEPTICWRTWAWTLDYKARVTEVQQEEFSIGCALEGYDIFSRQHLWVQGRVNSCKLGVEWISRTPKPCGCVDTSNHERSSETFRYLQSRQG